MTAGSSTQALQAGAATRRIQKFNLRDGMHHTSIERVEFGAKKRAGAAASRRHWGLPFPVSRRRVCCAMFASRSLRERRRAQRLPDRRAGSGASGN
jgi:hypothetical protein